MKKKTSLLHGLFIGVSLVTAIITAPVFSANSQDYLLIPPFLAQGVDKPNVMISLDVSGSMTEPAYPASDAFNPSRAYYGYFTEDATEDTPVPTTKYSYKPLTINGDTDNYFVPDANGDWDGNFLNWLTMRRIDVVRKVLVGGKVRDRDGENDSNGTEHYVVQLHNESSNKNTDPKSATTSSQYSPLADNASFRLERNGLLSTSTAITDKLEIGIVNIPAGLASQADITFANDYTSPIVVASFFSFNGSDASAVRAISVSDTGATIQLQEFPYISDQNHTAETVMYLVAEEGSHTIPMSDGSEVKFIAGSQSISSTGSGNTGTTITLNNLSTEWSNPFTNSDISVFAGISSKNESDTVVARVNNINSASFRVRLQEQSITGGSSNNQAHISERVDFVVIEHAQGTTTSGFTLEVDLQENFNHQPTELTFSSDYQKAPLVVAATQTTNDNETATLRYAQNTENGISLRVHQENSLGNGIANANEDVGYLSVNPNAYKLQIAVPEEPKGIIHQRAGEFRFGTAVYNFDHNSSNIYYNNFTHGSTMYPCYPEFEGQPRGEWKCKATHVRAPIGDIIDVIEDHPLIWGSTPIAEAMYDIWGYFQQTNYGRISGQPQYYDNGNSDQPSYLIDEEWDPYRNNADDILACTSSYILNFNDGDPYSDFDGSGQHPALTNIAVSAKGKGKNEAVDEVAYLLRTTDARPSSSGSKNVDGFQGITSYYVFADLGNDANDVALRRMMEGAARGGFTDLDENGHSNHVLDDSTPITAELDQYYNPSTQSGSCDPTTPDNNINEWDTDGNCVPDGFYFANDGAKLASELNAALDQAALTSASGGAASLVSTTTTGTGAFVRGLFSATGAENAIPWSGDINALMIDQDGLLRSDDDNDGVLDDYATDRIIDTCYDSQDGRKVKVKLSNDPADRPSEEDLESCNLSGDENDIKYLWSAQDWLANSGLNTTSQRAYASTTDGRHILTWLDADNNGEVDDGEFRNFVPDMIDSDNLGLLQATTTTQAQEIVRFTRGEELNGYRNRTLNGRVLRLGDNIYSTPTPVGRPAENLDLLYQDATYLDFVTTYRNRRQVVYAGTNDGLIHAFNGGFFNQATNTFLKAPPSGSDTPLTQYDLGAEIWAYMPYNLLPHLKYLSNTTYGRGDGDHLYMVDQPPRIFDARIFCTGSESSGQTCLPGQENTSHPHGWGTVLVMGMRLGGGQVTVDPDNDSTTTSNDLRDRNLQSAYVIMDITNPEQPPRLLREFTHSELGFTTSEPAPIVIGNNWYLMMGSGPTFTNFGDISSDQRARLFMLDMKTMSLATDFGNNGVLEVTGADNSFVGDILATDFDLDAETDSLYFGTVESQTRDTTGNTTQWSGDIYRLNIQDFSTTNGPTRSLSNLAASVLLADTGPIASKLNVTFDNNGNRWLYAGTGRFFNLADTTNTATQYFYGVKEPRDTDGSFTLAAANSNEILDVSNATVALATGEVSGLDSYLTGSNKNVTRLDTLMQGFDSSTTYRAGWKRELGTRERTLGTAALLGGVVSFTPYAPPAESCTFEGEAFLYSLHYTTGTAWRTQVLNVESDSNIITKLKIAETPVATISPHVGEPGSNEVVQNTQSGAGDIIQIETTTGDEVTSHITDWREL